MRGRCRVLIDRHALQSIIHIEDGVRLRGLLASSVAAGHDVAFTVRERLGTDELSHCDVLVIPTRSVNVPCRERQDLSYGSDEISAVTAFVRAGGGLLLATNHGGLGRSDHTREDARLAREFGIGIECTVFSTPPHALTWIGPECMAVDHPVIADGDPLRFLVTNTASSLVATAATPLIRLDSCMRNWDGSAPGDRLFSVAVRHEPSAGYGRVLVVSDSGILGTAGSVRPGIGLLSAGDNEAFVRNSVAWLGGVLRT